MTFDTFYLILPNREEQQKDQQRSRNKDAESAKQGGTLCVFLSFFPSCMSLWIESPKSVPLQMPASDLKRFFADVLSILSTTMQKAGPQP